MQIHDDSWGTTASVTPSGELYVTFITGSDGIFATVPTLAKGLTQISAASGGWQYYCDAEPGTAWDSSGWRISRRAMITASGINNGAVTQWASGNSNFDKKATLFTAYPYN